MSSHLWVESEGLPAFFIIVNAENDLRLAVAASLASKTVALNLHVLTKIYR